MDKTVLLAEARAAYHRLMTGTAVVSVWYNSRRTEFSQANASTLKAYIDELAKDVEGVSRRSAPAGVRF